MDWTAPGIVLSLEEYLRDPAPLPSLSSHIIEGLLTRSPAHAWWEHPRLNPAYAPTNGDALDLGTLAHRMVLEQRTDGVVVVPEKDWRKNSAKLARDEARVAGKVPILAAQWAELAAMVAAWQGRFQLLERIPFQGGAAERTFVWEEGGVWFRTRPDYLFPGGADDLKTTSISAHPAEWSRRRLWESGAYLQAALYHRAMRHLKRELGEFRFIVAEVSPPYGVSAIALDPEALEHAEQMVEEARDLWGRCLATNTWRGYPQRTAYAELPPWVKAKRTELAYYLEAVQP